MLLNLSHQQKTRFSEIEDNMEEQKKYEGKRF